MFEVDPNNQVTVQKVFGWTVTESHTDVQNKLNAKYITICYSMFFLFWFRMRFIDKSFCRFRTRCAQKKGNRYEATRCLLIVCLGTTTKWPVSYGKSKHHNQHKIAINIDETTYERVNMIKRTGKLLFKYTKISGIKGRHMGLSGCIFLECGSILRRPKKCAKINA